MSPHIMHKHICRFIYADTLRRHVAQAIYVAQAIVRRPGLAHTPCTCNDRLLRYLPGRASPRGRVSVSRWTTYHPGRSPKAHLVVGSPGRRLTWSSTGRNRSLVRGLLSLGRSLHSCTCLPSGHEGPKHATWIMHIRLLTLRWVPSLSKARQRHWAAATRDRPPSP